MKAQKSSQTSDTQLALEHVQSMTLELLVG
jgi:hypothetical protein